MARNKKGTVLIGSSMSNEEYAGLQAFISHPEIRMTQSSFFRMGARLLLTLTPERFIELGLHRNVAAASTLLGGKPGTEAKRCTQGQEKA